MFRGFLILPARSFLPLSASSQQSFSKYACSFVNEFDAMLFCWQTCYAITVWQSSPCDPFDPFAIFFNASQHAVHRRRLWQRQLVMQPWPYRTVGWEQLVCGFHFMSSIEMMEVPLQAQLPVRSVRRKCGIKSSTYPGSRIGTRKQHILTCQTCQTNLQMSCHCHCSTMLHL